MIKQFKQKGLAYCLDKYLWFGLRSAVLSAAAQILEWLDVKAQRAIQELMILWRLLRQSLLIQRQPTDLGCEDEHIRVSISHLVSTLIAVYTFTLCWGPTLLRQASRKLTYVSSSFFFNEISFESGHDREI